MGRGRRGGDRGAGARAAAGRAVEVDFVDTHVALLMRSIGGNLAFHRSSTTTLGVLDRVLLAGLARHGVVALLAVVVSVDKVHVSVLVDRHLQLIDGERLGVGIAVEGGTGRLRRGTLDALVLGVSAGELGATDGELLGAAAEAAAGHALHLEASVVGDGTLGHLRALEVETGFLLVGTLVARAGASGQLLAVAPVGLSNVLAPDTPRES